MLRAACTCALFFALSACDGAAGEADAGSARDATTDAPPTDAPTADASAPTDGASPVDASTSEVGPTEDASTTDGGTFSLGPYVTETRALSSSGVDRPFLLSHPTVVPAGLPLVFALHGDGGSGASMRTAFAIEAEATSGAVFVYPDAPGRTFEYYTYDGRTREARFVSDVIAALSAELSIDTGRVFILGFSGGATMTNALACRLGPGVVRGVGVHSGTLYSTDGPTGAEFTYTGSGGVSCALPDAIFAWGEEDRTDVSFAYGQDTRENYRATAGCATTTAPFGVAPCTAYDGCAHDVVWCPIAGLGHAVWPGAAHAFWAFFSTLD